MTPENRERHPVDMMDNDTPSGGNDSIDLTNEWPPLQDEPDETVALALEQRKNEATELAERLTTALLNEDAVVSDEDVRRLLVLGNDLRGLAAELSGRVPHDGMCEQRKQEQQESAD
jgi:hypothetical protein